MSTYFLVDGKKINAHQVPCPECEGEGWKLSPSGCSRRVCEDCDGSGASWVMDGCPACKGGFDGDLEWARIIDWKWYPDMNHYMVECKCGFSAEVIA